MLLPSTGSLTNMRGSNWKRLSQDIFEILQGHFCSFQVALTTRKPCPSMSTVSKVPIPPTKMEGVRLECGAKPKLLGLHVNLSKVEWYWMAVHDKIVSFWTYASLWGDSGRGECPNNIDDTIDEMVWKMPKEQWCGRQNKTWRKKQHSSFKLQCFNAPSPSVPLSSEFSRRQYCQLALAHG